MDINNMTKEQLVAEIARLKEAKAKLPKTISFKKTEKGGLSVYGLQRFPVTLYRDQWELLAKEMPAILEEIKDLPTKESLKA